MPSKTTEKKRLDVFIIEIEIDQDSWYVLPKKKPLYTVGKRILIPIKSNTYYNALTKFQNDSSGSEYPSYKIISIRKCDNKGFFNPDRYL